MTAVPFTRSARLRGQDRRGSRPRGSGGSARWPVVARARSALVLVSVPSATVRVSVIADAQARLPGLRPCGFHSPYEAAAWSVLAQRLRIVQAAGLRAELIARHGQDGAFPPPHTLARAALDLPGRKGEYLRAVAE